jgi:hypothetical protein
LVLLLNFWAKKVFLTFTNKFNVFYSKQGAKAPCFCYIENRKCTEQFMRNIFIVIIIIFSFSFISCDKNNKRVIINLPQTVTPVELNQWGVTKYASLSLRVDPVEEAVVKSHLPLGAIIEILKKDKELKNFENTANYWYFIDFKSENGWIFGSYIELFNTYDEAEKKSEEILFGTKKQ